MNPNFTESDWKALRRSKAAMLEALTARINREAGEILGSSDSTNSEKYYQLFDHIKASDRVIAKCFDGWKRSNMSIFTSILLNENLIPDELWESLSESATATLEAIREIQNS